MKIPSVPPTPSHNNNLSYNGYDSSSAAMTLDPTRTDSYLVVSSRGEEESGADQEPHHHQESHLTRGTSINTIGSGETGAPYLTSISFFVAPFLLGTRPTLPVMTIPVDEQQMVINDDDESTSYRHQMLLDIIEKALTIAEEEEPLDGCSEGEVTPN